MRCYRAHKQTIQDAEPARTQQLLHGAEAQLYLSARQLWPRGSQKEHYQKVLHTSKAAESKTYNKAAWTGQCTKTSHMERFHIVSHCVKYTKQSLFHKVSILKKPCMTQVEGEQVRSDSSQRVHTFADSKKDQPGCHALQLHHGC